MQSPLPAIDYSARDFESIKQALVDYLRQRFPDDFSDFTESQLGIAMLELTAYSYGLLSFMLDRQVNEVYITTARERRSLVKLANLLGYKITPALPAGVDLLLDTETLLANMQPGDELFIAGGTKVFAGDIGFELDQDYTVRLQALAGGQGIWFVNGAIATPDPTLPHVVALQGETFAESYESDGSKFLTLTVVNTPLISGSMVVTVADHPWVQVQSLALGDPTDPGNQQIYEVILDERDQASVRFGDGVTGDIPPAGVTVAITYRTGGGVVGNVAAGSIDQTIPGLINGVAIDIGVTNPEKATGGTDVESNEHIRFFAPAYARTTDRAVTQGDYFALCNGFTDFRNGTVVKAGILADPTDGISNVITIYAWGGDDRGDLFIPPSGSVGVARWTALKDSLRAFLDSRRTVGVYLTVQDGNFVNVDVATTLRIDNSRRQAEVQRAAEQALHDLFREARVRYGNELRVSWIYQALAAVPGVVAVHLSDPNPLTVTGLTQDLESGTLGSQAIATQPNQVVLPAGRAADFYANYHVRLSGLFSRSRRILTYRSDGLATLERAWDSPPLLNEPFSIWHPRRMRLDPTDPETDASVYRNRTISVLGRGTRTILDFQPTAVVFDKMIVVDRDWLTGYADPGLPYTIYGDYRAIDSQALQLGTVTIDILS